jgi:hypothetical protein
MAKSYPQPKQWYPKNPKKYNGDVNNIWYRSSWELRVFKWMDTNPNVIEYSSEEIKVPYISPIDGKYHVYYPDVIAKVKKFDGSIVTYMIEIKPYKQTIEPTPKKRLTKSYINEVYTWGVNSAKWKSANEYCRKRGWTFKLLTERGENGEKIF